MQSKTFAVEVITPEKLKFKGVAEAITVTTAAGEIAILANHAPLTALIAPGELKLKTEFKTMSFAVGEGFIQVLQNKAALLVDFAERAEEINYHEVLKEKERIEKELSSFEKKEDLNVEALKAKLQQEIVKLKVAKKL